MRLFGQLKQRARPPIQNASFVAFQDTTRSIRSDLRLIRRIEHGLVPKIQGLAILYTELIEDDLQLDTNPRRSNSTSESSTLTLASVVVAPATEAANAVSASLSS